MMWGHCLWRCLFASGGVNCCLSAVLAARQAMLLLDRQAMLLYPKFHCTSLPSPFAAELVGLGRALALARAWFFDIAERQCFAPRDGIRLHAARHVARRASLPAPRPRSGSLRLLHLRLRAWLLRDLICSPNSFVLGVNLTLLSFSSWWCLRRR
jgi:hypothetical protein